MNKRVLYLIMHLCSVILLVVSTAIVIFKGVFFSPFVIIPVAFAVVVVISIIMLAKTNK